jgi:hypothetical protein
MAYIDQEKKKTITKALKESFPNFDFKVLKDGKMAIKVNVYDNDLFKSSLENEKTNFYWKNDRHIKASSDFALIHFENVNHDVEGIILNEDEAPEIYNVIKKAGDWYDNSDLYTDYFNAAFYFSVTVFPNQ